MPEERKQAELAHLEEYGEKLLCLAALNRKIHDAAKTFGTLTSTIRGSGNTISAGDIATVQTFPKVVEDYRAIRSRCLELHEYLRNSGVSAEAIREVPLQQY